MCWVDIQEFKTIPTDDYRRSKAINIFTKYIRSGGVLQIGGIDGSEIARITAKIEESRTDPSVMTNAFYDDVQHICFLEIFQNVFSGFKATSQYAQLTKQLKEVYNNVRPDDFEYMDKLGEGGFGLVVHVKKKSTGKHYALKIQSKKSLLTCFADDPRRASDEKLAISTIHHPFIVAMDYAFQTNHLAMMVLSLGTGGDLYKALMNGDNMNEERVRFYAAEMILALGYMHDIGLMYRDLKPQNVLLNDDGHIQLVDMGGVLDTEGKVLDYTSGGSSSDGLSALFAQVKENVASSLQARRHVNTSENIDGSTDDGGGGSPVRSTRPMNHMSIMGTFGYMAPEMVIMLGQPSRARMGYTKAVDWWSLGVTMFKLLTGLSPFAEEDFDTFMGLVPNVAGRAAPAGLHEYAVLFQRVPYPKTMSEEVVNLITRLLDVDDRRRLGSGTDGARAIKQHPFFKSIDWDAVELKIVDPPFQPKKMPLRNTPSFSSFEAMLAEVGKGELAAQGETLEPAQQELFSGWNFISPHTLRIESGIANEMSQYDRNIKIQHLLGQKVAK